MSENTGNKLGHTIYEALAERIRRSIQGGEYVTGQLLGSEYELARQERISRMTVRRASEMLVNEGLLERRPGKGLYVRARLTGTRMVQMIVPTLSDLSTYLSRGTQPVAKEKGIQVQLYDAHGDIDLDLDMMRQLPTGPSRGAIILSLHSPAFAEALYHLKSQRYPFVLVDQRLEDIDVPSVVTDNNSGGYQVGQHLVSLGHRRIAFVGDLAATTVRARLAGFRDALADANLVFDRSLVIDLLVPQKERLSDWSGRVDKAVRDLMSRPSRPTAIFFSCDAVARSAYRTLTQMNIRIPQDLSIVGFDDDPLAEWLTPGLTTVRQSFTEVGRVAMEMLCQLMDKPDTPIECKVLPVELIKRESTAAPKVS